MTMKLFLILVILLHGFSNTVGQSIMIAAAADLRFVLDEAVKTFKETNPKIKIDIIYGSSGNLFQQISNQAPIDLFFSADNSYPLKLEELGLTGNKPKVYAIGRLVIWSATKDVTRGLDLLRSDDVKKISIANPDIAPYGKKAVECLKYFKLYELVKDKIVKGDNVSQAAQFVLTGNAEVGIIALSLALSPEMKGIGKYFLIDEKSYSKLEQSYVILKRSENNIDVLKFTKFLESEELKKCFSKYGFKLPKH